MPRPAPPTHSRSHKGQVHQVWIYSIHYSPVAQNLQFGVSRDGEVRHRARNMARAVGWALDRAQEFYNKNRGRKHDLVRLARETLEQHGRLLDVAQA
jgi:hypothetical protein